MRRPPLRVGEEVLLAEGRAAGEDGVAADDVDLEHDATVVDVLLRHDGLREVERGWGGAPQGGELPKPLL